jgi:Xaa-Pro aminopeptidase
MAVVTAAGDRILMTDGRYTEQAAEEADGCEVMIRGDEGYRPLLQAAVPPARVGVEVESISWAESERFRDWLTGVTLVATDGVVEAARMVKDDGELGRIEEAVRIGDEALLRVLPEIRPGRREIEIAAHLEASFRALGAEGPSFETIVAAGPNGAKPHHRAGASVLARGDLVVMDFGCVVDGYCSDMTRTVSLGPPSGDQRAMYDVVARAQEEARAAYEPGRSAADPNDIARRVVDEGGFGEHWQHPIGHGVGLEIHEAPWVRPRSADTLAGGHVVTDEPGVYVPGVGGVRIEDMVVVTESGCRTLTQSPTDLDFLII